MGFSVRTGIEGKERRFNSSLPVIIYELIIIWNIVSGRERGNHSKVFNVRDSILLITDLRIKVLFVFGCINSRGYRVRLGVFFGFTP